MSATVDFPLHFPVGTVGTGLAGTRAHKQSGTKVPGGFLLPVSPSTPYGYVTIC